MGGARLLSKRGSPKELCICGLATGRGLATGVVVGLDTFLLSGLDFSVKSIPVDLRSDNTCSY